MLNNAIREFARRLFGGDRMTVDELNQASEQIEEMPGKTDRYLSGTVGAIEGVGHRAWSYRLPDEGVATKVGRAQRRAGSYLAIAGALSPPDPAELDRTIDAVVAQAKANRFRLEAGEPILDFPKLDHFAEMGRALLGLNRGNDTIDEVRLRKAKSEIEVHAFDRRGHHVVEAHLSKHSPGVLYIDSLRATHGRNCDDLALDFGGLEVPGRGNALAVAAGLEALILECAKHGVHTIATSPGSPMVASLYQKMGFTAPGSDEPFARRRVEWLLEEFPILAEGVQAVNLIRKEHAENWVQKLDLTNPEAVRQALAGFRLSRAAIRDVPKDVAGRMVKLGLERPKPNHEEWVKELAETKNNVRVLHRRERTR